MMKTSIKEWAEEDRPREKMEERGAEALTSAELLAILIGSGTPEDSAVDLMRRIMKDCGGSLNTLGRLSQRELMQYKGIGPAKAITIMAACELGKRRMKEGAQQRTRISDADDIYDFFRSHFMDLSHEECHLLLLNVKHEVIGYETISQGGLTEASVDIRIILRYALLAGATTLAIAHNHPSGNCQPSRADDDLTSRLDNACSAVGIKLLDHLVIADGDNNYYSYFNHSKI